MSYAANFPYKWIAHFKDGTALRQFDPDGTQHMFDELWAKKDHIDYMQIEGLSLPIIINFPPEGADPIIFTRCRRDWDGNNEVNREWTFFGYKHLVGERVQKVLVVVHKETGFVSIEHDDSTVRG